MPGAQTEQKFEVNDKKQMLVLVRYKPAGAMAADDMLGGVASKVQGAVDAVENAANSVPGLSLFFKEEKDPDKKCDKEYNYYKDYKDWDSYMNKMKDELPNKLNPDNETIVFDFDGTDAKGRENEGKKLAAQIKSKISAWKNYTACFHFVGLGQGGNVANECIKELINEDDFKKKWKVASVVYVATPLYKNLHIFDAKAAGSPAIHAFGNAFDLTHQAIAYLEPNDQLIKLIAACNSNLLSIFTGKIKTQLAATLARLLSISSFGTGSDNKGNIDKITQVKDDASYLMSSLIEGIKSILNALPGLWDFNGIPDLKKLKDGLDAGLIKKGITRLGEAKDQLSKMVDSTGIDTAHANLGVLLNFLCPIVQQLTKMLQTLKPATETSQQLFDKLIDKSGVEKILSPGNLSFTSLPADPYIEKITEMAKEAAKSEEEQKKEASGEKEKTQEQIYYDQSVSMINACKNNIKALTQKNDLKVKGSSLTDKEKEKIGEIFAALLLPMMPSKKKFFGAILHFIPTSVNAFLASISGDAAMAPINSLLAKVPVKFEIDYTPGDGKGKEPGLGFCIQEFFKEVDRIKGYLNKNNFPIHKDANSLYFIYNSHNILLKKPWGDVMNTIDKETGYYDAMVAQGYNNIVNLKENKYEGGGAQKDNVQPAKTVEAEKETAA